MSKEAMKLALEALECTEYPQDHYDAITALREALAEQPAQDNTYGYAKYLAEAMFKRHFASDEHYASGRVVWGVNDTVIGILTQIDNMVADMVRRPAQQEPVLWQILNGVCHAGIRSTENLAKEAAAGMQKIHDLGGSLAAFHVRPLYTAPQAQPAQQEHFDHKAAANAALRDAQNRSYQVAKSTQPAQQEPVAIGEPVGWYSKQYGFVYMALQPHQFDVGSTLYLKNGAPAWRIESSCSMTALISMSSLPHGTVFYTSPPASKPLTDEQILAANYPDGEENGPTIAAPDFELICFARQIEAKLREKNNG